MEELLADIADYQQENGTNENLDAITKIINAYNKRKVITDEILGDLRDMFISTISPYFDQSNFGDDLARLVNNLLDC